MLHAELHGKLAHDATDAERREDILTSTVFGVLFNVEAWQVIIDWLGRARPVGHDTPLILSNADVRQYWFWPRLDNAEPDLVIRLGACLAIVEAKFHSGKSGKDAAVTVTDRPAVVKDQLVREWRACSPHAATWLYPSELREAVTSCSPALVYLVKRNRLARERLTVTESLQQEPTAKMYLLTWEDLDEVLAVTIARRWVTELRAYLQRRRLTAFRGFAGTVTAGGPATPDWRYAPRTAHDLRC